MKNLSSVTRGGYTLLELLVVIGIVALLFGLIIHISSTFKKRAEMAKCLSHMRAIHTGFVAHMEDTGSWPQMPGGMDKVDFSETEFFGFWVKALEPYGVSQDTWHCPSDKIMFEEATKNKDRDDYYFGSYIPTRFDKGIHTPLRWSQPWLLERGDLHGKGAHVLLPDGSILSTQNPFHSR